MRVAVQVFSYRETFDDLTRTMDAYAACEIPDFVADVTYEACVTPAGITAGHPDAARAHPAFDLVETPKGKIASRNHAHDRGVATGADVIVSGDADAPPVGQEYLTRLLAPFEDPDVVATTGIQHDDNPVTFWFTHLGYELDMLRNPLYGRSSAVSAGGWDAAGPFRDDVDQSNVYSMRDEEEFDFRERLESVGRVETVRSARVHTNLRRYRCFVEKQYGKIGRKVSPYCQSHTGGDTFHPR